MNLFKYILWLLLAVILQVLLFNHLSLFGGIVMIYMVALLKMPVEFNRVLQILIGFLTGLIIDIFCNTLGMHALTAVTVMFFREPILHLYNNDPEFKVGTVCLSRIGLSSFMRYALTVLGMHCALLYVIEAFTLFNFLLLVIKIVVSLLLTFAFTMALEFATEK